MVSSTPVVSPGDGALTLSGRVGEVMQESARTALSWLRANAGRYGLDASFHRAADLHLHVQSSAAHNDGASAGVTMAGRRTPRPAPCR